MQIEDDKLIVFIHLFVVGTQDIIISLNIHIILQYRGALSNLEMLS